MSNDPFAGIGGSYTMDPDGTRQLVERTGHVPDAPAAEIPLAAIETDADDDASHTRTARNAPPLR